MLEMEAYKVRGQFSKIQSCIGGMKYPTHCTFKAEPTHDHADYTLQVHLSNSPIPRTLSEVTPQAQSLIWQIFQSIAVKRLMVYYIIILKLLVRVRVCVMGGK